jgi:hypothetical protein
LLRLGSRFNVPLHQWHIQGRSHFLGQHGFACSWLSFNEQRTLKLYRGIDSQFQVISGYIALRAIEAGLDLGHGEGNQFVCG